VESLANTAFNRRNVLARHHATFNGVDELEATTLLEGLKLEHHVTVLTTTARLLDELAFDFFADPTNGLTIGNLRLTDVGINIEFTAQAVDEHLKVQLAHTGNNSLAGLFVGRHAERGVFRSQA